MGRINFYELAMSIIDAGNATVALHQADRVCMQRFSTATSSRFEHSIGVYHVAKKLCWSLKRTFHFQEGFPNEKNCFDALIHDLGHGPYSSC